MSGQWVPEVGENVAVVVKNRDWESVNFRKVVRVGKRDVVLDDEQRFSISRGLVRRDDGSWSMRTTACLPAGAPVIAEAMASIRHRKVLNAARNACEDFRLGKVSAPDAILALAPLTGVADEIAALFTDTPA